MHFFKYSCLGNDFILINNIEKNIPDKNFPELAKHLCKRRFSIGADGILVFEKSQKADFKIKIFNSDGSEAEMCGNGIRGLTKHVYENKLTTKTEIQIETKGGIIITKLILNGNLVEKIQVDMGTPKLLRNEIPMSGENTKVIAEKLKVDDEIYTITCVSMGNPHCVIYQDDLKLVDIKIGQKIEHHPIFPNRVNVEFTQVLNEQELSVRVWERGAGETLSCGTGACAVIVSSVLNNLVKKNQLITVHLPGGDLKIKWAENDHVYMIGPAEKSFEGDLDITT